MSTTLLTFQPAASYQEALERAARLWGLEPEYCDTWHQRHVTSPEIQRAILKALGVPAESREELDQAVEERLWDQWNSLLPPVLVLGENSGPREFPLHLPGSLADRELAIEVRLEEGATENWEIPLGGLRATGQASLRGQWFCRKQAPLPQHLPLGYHDLRVSVSSPDGVTRRAAMPLILCPDRAYVPPVIRDGGRTAGLAIGLYGLRSARNWGCGDFTDLEGLIDWLAQEVGVTFVGLNPLHDIPNRYPFNISPYLPNSAFYKNCLYLDVERLEDFQNSPRARDLLARPEVQAELEALRGSPHVQYERVHALKLRALKLSFLAFLGEFRKGGGRARQFEEFIRQEGELLDRFAIHCALAEWMHARYPEVWVWPDWPEAFRDPDSEAVRSFARRHWRAVLFYKYVQWQVDLQLAAAQQHARRNGLHIGLYHDLALAADRCGADLWAHRAFYVAGCRVGAPPDGFAPKGQDWSFPPPNSQHHRATGYRLFRESIRKNCRHGGALRIDHVMRFFRLYWIPEGLPPTQGAYLQDSYQDLLHILALESVRHEVAIVGEDLGTVTPEIRQALDRFAIFRYRVLYFEKNDRNEFRLPQEYPAEALVSSSTHDLPTLAGFWLARDIHARHGAGLLPEASYHTQLAQRAFETQQLLDVLFRLGLLPEWVPRSAARIPELTGELHNALVGFLATTPCRLMTLNQEDLTKETEQQNLPASTWQYPNWQRKMKFSLEELRSAPQARDFTRMFRNWLDRSGRLPR